MVKVACVLALIFCAVGAARVAIADVTTATLNANAEMTNAIETAQEQASNLEVMRSVYGSHTRIRDLAADTLGMVEAEGGVTIDLS